MTAKGWLYLVLALVLAAGIGGPLLAQWLRERDFRAQVSGKKPMRRADEDSPILQREAAPKDPDAEGQKWIAELKSKQNFWGFRR